MEAEEVKKEVNEKVDGVLEKIPFDKINEKCGGKLPMSRNAKIGMLLGAGIVALVILVLIIVGLASCGGSYADYAPKEAEGILCIDYKKISGHEVFSEIQKIESYKDWEKSLSKKLKAYDMEFEDYLKIQNWTFVLDNGAISLVKFDKSVAKSVIENKVSTLKKLHMKVDDDEIDGKPALLVKNVVCAIATNSKTVQFSAGRTLFDTPLKKEGKCKISDYFDTGCMVCVVAEESENILREIFSRGDITDDMKDAKMAKQCIKGKGSDIQYTVKVLYKDSKTAEKTLKDYQNAVKELKSAADDDDALMKNAEVKRSGDEIIISSVLTSKQAAKLMYHFLAFQTLLFSDL